MNIMEQMRVHFAQAIKSRNTTQKNIMSYLLGTLQRYTCTKENPGKTLPDNVTLEKLKKLKMDIEDNISKYPEKINEEKDLLAVINQYLPPQLSREGIVSWIQENVNFDEVKPKQKVIGMIKSQFGTSIDGKLVQDVLNNEFANI